MDRGQIDVSSYKHVDDVHVSCVCVTEPPPPPPVWPTVLAAVLVTLIILAAAFGLFVCYAYKRMKDREGVCVCFIICVCVRFHRADQEVEAAAITFTCYSVTQSHIQSFSCCVHLIHNNN